MNNMLKTTLQTWLVTCFIGALLLCVSFSFMEGNIDGEEYLLVMGIGFGLSLAASVPGMILFGALANFLLGKMEVARAKALCSVYAVLITVFCLWLVLRSFGNVTSNDFGYGLLLVAAPFILAFILAIWMFRWPQPGPDPEVPLDVLPDGSIAEHRPFPAIIFYAVTAIAAVVLLATVFQWITATGDYWRHHNLIAMALGILGSGLLVAGLVLFLKKQAAGWKILALVFYGGLTGALVSLITSMNLLLRQTGIMTSYLLHMGFFAALDITAIVLLGKPALRHFFRISAHEYRLWVLAGIGYGLLYSVLSWLLFRY